MSKRSKLVDALMDIQSLIYLQSKTYAFKLDGVLDMKACICVLDPMSRDEVLRKIDECIQNLPPERKRKAVKS